MEIPIENLPALCDEGKMSLLIISRDMSFQFKFMDLVNKKAFSYLDNGSGNIDIDKFLKWWYCKLDHLKEFNKDVV